MKNLIRKYGTTLTGPELRKRTKVFRWAGVSLYLFGFALNMALGIRNSIRGELTPAISFTAALFVLAMLVVLIKSWKMTDDNRRKRSQLLAELDREMFRSRRNADRDVIPITEPEDAADPFAYAMMRAMKEGGGVHIVRGEDGLWRDGSTEQVIPIQDEGSGPEKGA